MSNTKLNPDVHTLAEAGDILKMSPNEIVLRMQKIGINMAALRVKTLTSAQVAKIKRVK